MTAQLVKQPPLFTPDPLTPDPLTPDRRPAGSGSAVVWAMSQAVPHHLIASPAVSDSAVVLWVVLGTVPKVDFEACTFSPDWLAARAGWGITGEAAARRVRRAVSELVQAGALQVVRTGRTRPAYRRLLLPAEGGRKWERTTLTEVRGLSPSLWRSLLRWREVMGSQHRTRLPLAVLAVRWRTSPRQLRRQLAALIDAGYLVDAGRHGIQDAIHRPPGKQAGKPARERPARTFLSGSSERKSGHFCPPKKDIPSQETHPTVGPQGLDTSPRPPQQQPAEAAPRPTEDRSTDQHLQAPQAAEAPPAADDATRQAWRLIQQTRWLATAPEHVRWQARSLIAGTLRRQRFTADDIRTALHRIEPDGTAGQQCRLIRAALAGVRADRLTAQRPLSAAPPGDEERADEPARLPAHARADLAATLEAAQKRSAARWAAPPRPGCTRGRSGAGNPGDGSPDPIPTPAGPPETLHRLHPQYRPPARSGPSRYEQMTAGAWANNHDGDLAISPSTRNDG